MRGALFLSSLLLWAGAVQAQPFEREISPFPVSGRDGVELPQPFLGGFDVPRPVLADVTGDGLPDLIIQELSGSAMLFENTSTPGAPSFAWRTDRFGNLEIGEWVRLVDADGDGDLDVFAEQPFNTVRYYRNDAGTYTLALTMVQTSEGVAVTVDRQSQPAFGDITCDGLPDLLTAELDGTLTLYPALPPQDGLPRFAPPIHRFQDIEIVGALGKNANPKHGASSITLADVDDDGDLDLIWGDFFAPSLYLLRDVDGCPAPRFVREETPFPTPDFSTGGYNAPAWGDIDGDGRGDLLVGVLGGAFVSPQTPGTTDNLYHFAHTAAGTFEQRATRFLPTLDAGTLSRVAWGDLDGDGDLDLIVSTQIDSTRQQGRLLAWENTGTAAQPRYLPRALVLPPDPRYGLAPALGDLDGDGKLDLLVGGFDGSVYFYRATGPFAFAATDAAPLRLTRGSNAAPALGDLDGDGDLDLIVGEASGDLNAYRNDGSRFSPRFVLTSEALLERPGQDVTPVLADLDGDGDLDLFVGTQAGYVLRAENTGTARQMAFALFDTLVTATPRASLYPLSAPALADIDGDGDLDLLLGTASGGLLFYRNRRISTAVAPPHFLTVLRDVKAFPNPFSSTVAVTFTLEASARVEVCVFDLLGRPAGCTAAAFAAGTHALPLALEKAAGVYFYRVQAGDEHVTGKLVRL